MKALILIQSARLDTYLNIFAAICKKYPDVEHIEILYINENNTSITKRHIREGLVELSKKYPHYESAADVHLTSNKSSIEHLKEYIKEWDIIDVTGVSKELSLTIAAMSISYKHTKVCLINWTKQFKQGEKWIINDMNHKYINLLSSGDLSLLRKDYWKKTHMIIAFGIIFGLLAIVSIYKMLNPEFFIPNDIVNIFGLLVGIAGLYLASISLKKD